MNKTALYLIYFCIYSAALLLIGKSTVHLYIRGHLAVRHHDFKPHRRGV